MFGLLDWIKVLGGATAGAALMFAAALAYDRLIDDRAVAAAAREGFVARSELTAERARNELLLKINAAQASRLGALRTANDQFAADLAAARTLKEGLADELAEMAARPVNPACVVDDALFDRLRGR
jgi:DNA-binding PucR family transcriptional regulator